jgi:hypothetical protein
MNREELEDLQAVISAADVALVENQDESKTKELTEARNKAYENLEEWCRKNVDDSIAGIGDAGFVYHAEIFHPEFIEGWKKLAKKSQVDSWLGWQSECLYYAYVQANAPKNLAKFIREYENYPNPPSKPVTRYFIVFNGEKKFSVWSAFEYLDGTASEDELIFASDDPKEFEKFYENLP